MEGDLVNLETRKRGRVHAASIRHAVPQGEKHAEIMGGSGGVHHVDPRRLRLQHISAER